jgi:isopentenyl phosphate kinase
MTRPAPVEEVMLVKLGGSLLTDKRRPGTLRRDVVARLAAELAAGLPRARRRGVAVVLGHGSGSFGHVAAAQSGIADGLGPAERGGGGRGGAERAGGERGGEERAARLAGASATQARAAELHGEVTAALRIARLAPFSLAPSSLLVAAGRRPAEMAAEPLLLALAEGFLPVLYGDVVLDRRQGVAICSTERVFAAAAEALAAHGLRVREALWLGETAGVYDQAGEVIPEIAPGGPAAAAAHAGAAAGTDVTGGMAHRLETALALAEGGIVSTLADGTVPGLLERALAGEPVPGTRVLPPR